MPLFPNPPTATEEFTTGEEMDGLVYKGRLVMMEFAACIEE
jgi:hypothetical protein